MIDMQKEITIPAYENQNVEFKREYVDSLNKEVIAFANTDGGTIFVGIDKDTQVIGIEDPDNDMLKIANSLKDSIAPDIMPFVSINAVNINDLPVIKIDVSTGTNRPYYIRAKGLKPSGVYIRKRSSSQPLSEDGIREMIRQVDGKSFEEERSLIQDLSFNEELGKDSPDFNQGRNCLFPLERTGFVYTVLRHHGSYCPKCSYSNCLTINARPQIFGF
jgi:ATP-dependent DNA helicase RecG